MPEFLNALNVTLTDPIALAGALPENLRNAANVYSKDELTGLPFSTTGISKYLGVNAAGNNVSAHPPLVNVADYSSYATALSIVGVDQPIVLPGLGWDIGENNLYSATGSIYKNALGPQFLVGARATPTSKAEPIMWLEKFSSVSRDAPTPSAWDQNFYAMIKKISGSAYAASVTGAVRHEAGSGQMVGVHGRGEARHAAAEVWGGWSYGFVNALATSGAYSVIAHEVDLNNQGPDIGWMEAGGVGNTRGVVSVSADGSNPVTHFYYAGAGASAPNGRAWTGFLIAGNSIMRPTAALGAIGDGEAIRIRGDSEATEEGYGGIRFKGGKMRYCLSTVEVSISNNAAIILDDGHRIVVGFGPSGTNYMQFNRVAANINFNNLVLHINGIKVLGVQQTAVANATDAASVITQLNALLARLRTHGLIAT